MPRPRRIDHPGAYHHVMNRGRNRQPIHGDDADWDIFLEHLGTAAMTCRIEVHSFALMNNHYHMLLRSLEGRLSEAMQVLGSRYAQDINIKYGFDGTLFKGRFYSKLIDSESYLLEAARYIPNNPIKAGLVSRPEDYPFSSYACTMGVRRSPAFLQSTALVDEYFNGDAAAFDAFVRARDTERSAIFAHIADSCGPHQPLSDAIATVEAAMSGLQSFPLRDGWLASKRDLVFEYVQSAFGVDRYGLAAPRSAHERDARFMLLKLLQHHEIATITALAPAFGFAHRASAARAIRRFETRIGIVRELGSIARRGQALFARAA